MFLFRFRTIAPFGVFWFAFGWIVLFVGCSSKTTNLSGVVTIDGQPVRSGFILFQYPDGQVFSTPIGFDGGYAIANLPRGLAAIAIRDDTISGVKIRQEIKLPPSINGPKLSADNVRKEDKTYIPKKYCAVSSSGLSLDIQHTTMTFDISLTP
jgi:hypothetical protein